MLCLVKKLNNEFKYAHIIHLPKILKPFYHRLKEIQVHKNLKLHLAIIQW